MNSLSLWQDADQDEDTVQPAGLCLHGNHGKNIMLTHGHTTAQRTASYNQAVVVSSLPLPRNRTLEVSVFLMIWIMIMMVMVMVMVITILIFMSGNNNDSVKD